MDSIRSRLTVPRTLGFHAASSSPPATLDEWAADDECVRRARDLVRCSTGPILLTGAAGTGKSLFLALCRAETPMRTVVLASTGIAALQVSGLTVHSYFRLPHRLLAAGNAVPGDRAPVYAAMEALIIDEVSMLRADVVDVLDHMLKRARRSAAAFGGVRVLFVGDPFQLAPVVDSKETAILKRLGYVGPWFFQAKVFRDAPLQVATLERIHRQPDPAFALLLSRVRAGNLSQRDMELLNSRVSARGGLISEPALVLTTTRAAAHRENSARLTALADSGRTYIGVVEGVYSQELPVPQELVLKPEARVMFTRNDVDRRWANGSTGTVIACEAGEILVRTDHDPENIQRVGPVTWEHVRHTYDRGTKRVDTEVIGRYAQLPCVLGWASTVHKCQGMSIDSAKIDLGVGSFAAGQSYVAVSRVRTMNGLELARPIRQQDVWTDPKVVTFMDTARQQRNDDAA
jgi:hypothetical protein